MSRPLLSLLVGIDLIFITISVWFWLHGVPDGPFNVEVDGGYAERFQYLKWLISAVGCGYAFGRSRAPLYLAWLALFAYFLFDDSRSFHEINGFKMAVALGFSPAFALRAVDFGELLTSLAAGAVLFGAIALCYLKSTDEPARTFSRQLLPWLLLLIFCGVIVDMIHIQVMLLSGDPLAVMLTGLVEDGGEMIAASGLTATVVRSAWRLKRRTLAVPAPA